MQAIRDVQHIYCLKVVQYVVFVSRCAHVNVNCGVCVCVLRH